jgi:hypothetical protein
MLRRDGGPAMTKTAMESMSGLFNVFPQQNVHGLNA